MHSLNFDSYLQGVHLTTQTTQAYSPLIASSDVIGIGLLSKAANSRNAPSNVAFLRLVLPFMGGLGGEPQGSPVRFPGSPTRPVPPTRLDSGVRLNQLNESEHTMTDNPLIPVFTGILQNDSVQLCNARDLHTYLQIGKDFTTWIKARIHQYGFTEGEDYVGFSPNLGNRPENLADSDSSNCSPKLGSKRGGHNRTEYHLTLDMAKELAMVENNEQGKAARRYFIELERQRNQDAALSKALTNISESPLIETQAPDVNYLIRRRFDPEIKVIGERVTTSSEEVARVFNKNHYNVIKKIETLECTKDFIQQNFEQIKRTLDNGLKETSYDMTKDGFIFLVMSYTGYDVPQLKEAYIHKFNAMEQSIIEQQMDKLINLAPYPVLMLPPDKFTTNLRKKIAQKAHALSVAQYEVILDLITNRVQQSLDNEASEQQCEHYIEQFGTLDSNVTLINTHELYQLARRTTSLLDEAGSTLALIHQLEAHTGLELYTRKGNLPIKTALVEEVFNLIKQQNTKRRKS